jgi:TPR repeat protein
MFSLAKAAAQGSTDSEKRLGDLYASGVLAPQSDYAEAARWYIKAIQHKKPN